MNKKILLPVIAAVVLATVGVLYMSGTFSNKSVPGSSMSLNADVNEKGAVMQNLYTSLEQQVKGNTTMQARMNNDQIDLVDASSGSVVCSIRQVNDQQVSLTSVVARLNSLPADKRKGVEQQISDFNMNSSVGVMTLQPAGDLTLEHKLNPQANNPETMAKTAVLFGDKVRQQSQKFAELQTAAM